MAQQDEPLLNFPTAYASWRESGQDSSKANEIYEIFRAHGRTHEVFRKAFSREIRSNDSTFLRHSSSSLSLQLLNILFKSQISKKFIKRIVGAFLSRLMALPDTKRTNVDVVELCVGFLRDKFTSRIQLCPVEIKMAFRELQRLLIKYKRPETLLESAFFLHYICPAVILPTEWDLVSESPSGDQLQSLILACRFLQCAANGTNFPDSDPRVGFAQVEAKTVMHRAMKSMLDLEDSPPSVPAAAEPDSRRALLGEIVKAAGRAKSVTASAKSRRASDIPLRKERSQTMSSPQLSSIGESTPEVAGETPGAADKSTLRNSELRKSASFSKRKSMRMQQAGASTASASLAADADAGAGSEDDTDSGSESPHNGLGQPKSPAKQKRTPLIQAIRNTAASKKRNSVALLSLSDPTSAVGTQLDEQPTTVITSPNRSDIISLRVDIPPELKARTVLNLDQEKELFGDLLWRNQRTIVLMLRSLTSSEGFVRAMINQLTTNCSDFLSSNRVGVVLVAYGHANAAQQLRKTLPFGYVLCIDKRRRIYDTLGCIRLHDKDDETRDDLGNPRSSSIDSTPGESSSLTSASTNSLQLGGVFGFARHQLVAQFIESNKDDQCDIEAIVRTTIRNLDDEPVVAPKAPLVPESTDDEIAAKSNKSHSEAEIPVLKVSRSSSTEGRRKTSSSRNLATKNL